MSNMSAILEIILRKWKKKLITLSFFFFFFLQHTLTCSFYFPFFLSLRTLLVAYTAAQGIWISMDVLAVTNAQYYGLTAYIRISIFPL